MKNVVHIPLHRSFLGRLLFFMLLIGILPVVINAAISYNLAQKALDEATDEMQTIIEKDQTAYILAWANERNQDIVTLAGVARITSMNPETANEAIKQYYRLWGGYETIFLVDLRGNQLPHQTIIRWM